MAAHVVIASALNLRSSPALVRGNVVTELPHGMPVEVREDLGIWAEVEAVLYGRKVNGYVASRYLRPATESQPATAASQIAQVHLPPSERSRLKVAGFQQFPLFGLRPVERDGTAAQKRSALHGIVERLDVEASARYAPTAAATFCNIYAHDFCYLAGVYLPRVWWNSKSLIDLKAGKSVTPVYAQTVFEMTANALFDWLWEWGDDFGWANTSDQADLQAKVNHGAVGVICAKRRSLQRSGHITCVLPERPGLSARRSGSTVIASLQSQAGKRNKMYFADDWWVRLSAEFSGVSWWVHP